jgi:hypothetical protein
MALQYSILISKECINSIILNNSVKRISKIDPIVVDLPKGFAVYNTTDKIGFGYSLIDTKDQLWGYEDELLQEDFRFEQSICFRLSNNLDYNKVIKKLFLVLLDLFLKIHCDFIFLGNDEVMLFRKNNIFFATKENINWLNNEIDYIPFEINLLSNSNGIK